MAEEEVKKPEEEEVKTPEEEESKEEVEEDVEVVEDETEATDDELEEKSDLSVPMRDALAKLKVGEYSAAEKILNEGILNIGKFSLPNAKEIKTLREAQSLLERAASDLEEREKEVNKLKSEVSKLKKFEEKIEKLNSAKLDKAVNKLVERKLSLGLIKQETVDEQKTTLRKLSTKMLVDMEKELENINATPARKETLKGAESTEQEDAKKANLRQHMINAGLKTEFIDEYLKTKE